VCTQAADGHRISHSVKRIVITSSGAAIIRESPTPITFSELDWNEQSLEIVREKGREAPNPMKYRASKTLAEKGTVTAGLYTCSSRTNTHVNTIAAAWEFWNEHKADVGWDLTILNPTYVSRFFFLRSY